MIERIDCACGKATWIGDDGVQVEIYDLDFHRRQILFREHHCRISKELGLVKLNIH